MCSFRSRSFNTGVRALHCRTVWRSCSVPCPLVQFALRWMAALYRAPELKERRCARETRKKVIESGKHSQRGSIPTQSQRHPLAHTLDAYWSSYILLLSYWRTALSLLPVRPSPWIFPMKRGEILHRSGLSDFTVGPFRVQIRPALWTCWCVLSNK